MKDEGEIPYKTYLAEDELPTAWYNLRADSIPSSFRIRFRFATRGT